MFWSKWFFGDQAIKNSSYHELKSHRIISTLRTLQQRISERFPEAGLNKVAKELIDFANEIEQLSKRFKRPIWVLRILTLIAIFVLLLVFGGVVAISLDYSLHLDNISDLLQGVESAINELIFLSIAVFFLSTLERRFKRQAALKSLHRLRSIAHVVDMHQLTKDPAYLLSNAATTTTSSPERTMSAYELVRYLDYCSELLSITSKLAALHAQYLDDTVVLSAVNDVESLSQGLSGKIWQKIMILDLAAQPGRED